MEKKQKTFVICFLPWVLIGPFNVQYKKVQFQVIPESAHFEKKDETAPKYPHFLVVSTKFGTISFQTFCLKKQEEICHSEENYINKELNKIKIKIIIFVFTFFNTNNFCIHLYPQDYKL
jgi:hypothetical protein